MSEREMIDRAAFAVARDIMQGKFLRILGYFFEDTEKYIIAMLDGIRGHDLDIVISTAHTMKSSSMQLGAVVLSQEAAALELTAKAALMTQADWVLLIEQANRLEGYYKTTRQMLEQLGSQSQ